MISKQQQHLAKPTNNWWCSVAGCCLLPAEASVMKYNLLFEMEEDKIRSNRHCEKKFTCSIITEWTEVNRRERALAFTFRESECFVFIVFDFCCCSCFVDVPLWFRFWHIWFISLIFDWETVFVCDQLRFHLFSLKCARARVRSDDRSESRELSINNFKCRSTYSNTRW